MIRAGNLICALAFISLVLLSGSVFAEVYKWVDANGKVHYSDRKVDAAAVKLDISSGAASLGGSGHDAEQRFMQQKKYLNYLSSERQERAEEREEQKQQEAKQKKYCMTLQNQLNSFMNDHVSWYDIDEKTGERVYLSDKKLENRIQELQAEIETSCS